MVASSVLNPASKLNYLSLYETLKAFLSHHMFKLKTAHQSVQGLWHFLALAPVHAYKPLIAASHGPFHIPQHLHFFQKGNPRYEMTLLSLQEQNTKGKMSVSSALNHTSKISFYTSMEFSTLVVMR
jgi:hypothetical protein